MFLRRCKLRGRTRRKRLKNEHLAGSQVVLFKPLTGFNRRNAGFVDAGHARKERSQRSESSMILVGRGRRQSKTDVSLELLSKPGHKHGSRFRAHASGDVDGPNEDAATIPFRRVLFLHDLGRRPRRLSVEVI